MTSYLTPRFDASLSTLTLEPGPACPTTAGYTLFSSTGELALSRPLSLAVNGASTTVTVHACCAALTGATKLSCSASLQRLTVDVQSLLNAESLALSSLAAVASAAAAAAALADTSLLCDGTYAVCVNYTRFATGASCTCQCVQYDAVALENCTLAQPSCANTPPAPPSPPDDGGLDGGAVWAIVLSVFFAGGALLLVAHQSWLERSRPKAYNVQIGGSA